MLQKKTYDALLAKDRRLEMLHNTTKEPYERLAELSSSTVNLQAVLE